MAEKILVVVDMQKDFIDGSLGTKEAEAIAENVVKKAEAFDGQVIFTRDTHHDNYLETQEGKYLPVAHCVEHTEGWQLDPRLEKLRLEKGAACFDKPTFGSVALAEELKKEHEASGIESIELVGLCTDICVISNALLLKAYLPEVPIFVDAACCAGVTPEKHQAALETMRSCQIQIR